MKRVSILFLVIIAAVAFGFVSYSSIGEGSSTPEVNEMTALKGAEKSGFSESNQNW